MASISLPPVTRVLNHDQDEQRFEPFTQWVPAIHFEGVQSLYMLRDNTGTMTVASAWQVATTDPNAPSATPIAISTFRSANGRYTDSIISSTFYNNVRPAFWIRFGVFIKAASGPAQVEVTLSIVGRD